MILFGLLVLAALVFEECLRFNRDLSAACRWTHEGMH